MHQELHKSHYQGDSDEDGDVLCGAFPTETWQSNATAQTCKAILSGEIIFQTKCRPEALTCSTHLRTNLRPTDLLARGYTTMQ